MTKLYTKATWADEVLSGAERYDILENGGGAFKSNMQINLATSVATAGTEMNAAKMNNIENGIDALDTLLSSIRNDATELTLSSDTITITQSNHKLQPQTGTSDNLSTINGAVAGQSGVLYVSDFGTDTITIKHNVGNILCVGGSDIALSNGAVFWYSNGTKIFMVGGGGSGGVAGPGSSTNGNIASFNGTTGQTIQDSGKAVPSGTIVGNTDTQTLTNKRVQRRQYSTTSTSTLTPEIDTYDKFLLTAQAANLTVANHSTSTPAAGERIQIDIQPDATPRTLSFGTNYVAKNGLPLPTVTVASKRMKLTFEWESDLSKFNLIAYGQES